MNTTRLLWSKVEIRQARGSDPSTPHRLTVEYLTKWNVWFIDVNPTTVAVRGRPIRNVVYDTKAKALEVANILSKEITSTGKLTEAG